MAVGAAVVKGAAMAETATAAAAAERRLPGAVEKEVAKLANLMPVVAATAEAAPGAAISEQALAAASLVWSLLTQTAC